MLARSVLVCMLFLGAALAGPCFLKTPEGPFFDLFPLQLTSGAYDVFSGSSRYTMNSCGVSNDAGDCSAEGGSICQYGPSSYHSFMGSLGSFTKLPLPTITALGTAGDWKGVAVNFTNGDQCANNATRVTVVNYLCFLGVSPQLELVSGDDQSCTKVFNLKSAMGCPHVPPPTCSWIAPSGDRFDLSPMHKTSGSFSAFSGSTRYTMNVCGVSAEDPECAAEGGAICRYIPSSYHSFGGQLGSFYRGPRPTWALLDAKNPKAGVSLTFKNAPCGNATRTTTVQFKCGEGNDTMEVVSGDDNSCEHTFVVSSPSACPQAVRPCAYQAPSGERFDLSSMRRESGGYEVFSEAKRYTMNVCGESNDMGDCSEEGGSICVYGPSMVKSYGGSLGSWTQPALPTFALVDPAAPKKGVAVTFVNGRQCAQNATMEPQTTIIDFLCDEKEELADNGDETPCRHRFTFRSPHACPLPMEPTFSVAIM